MRDRLVTLKHAQRHKAVLGLVETHPDQDLEPLDTTRQIRFAQRAERGCCRTVMKACGDQRDSPSTA